MSKQVYWILELEIVEGKSDVLRDLATEMVSATRENEPGALHYDWSLSEDGRQCHIFEHYADSAAVMTHLATFQQKYAARFLEILKPTRFVIYGSPDPAVREALSPFQPDYMASVDGFSR